MSKNVRLNKNQLINLISESVNRIINENDDYDSFYGDYYDYDTDQIYTEKVKELCKRIEYGYYDNKLDKILDIGAGEYFDIPVDTGVDSWVDHAAFNRKGLIDKGFAIEHADGYWNDKDWKLAPGASDYFTEHGNEYNRNIKNYPFHNDNILRNDNLWKEKQHAEWHKQYPNIWDKNGNVKYNKNTVSNFKKAFIGTDQYDKRPLHRKGSLNREIK